MVLEIVVQPKSTESNGVVTTVPLAAIFASRGSIGMQLNFAIKGRACPWEEP